MTLMTENTFKSLIAAYGSDPSRWPKDRQDQALAFAATDKGKTLLSREALLDDLLAANSEPKPADLAFLNGLLKIPDTYVKMVHGQKANHKSSFLEQLRFQLPEIANWLRPGALAAQGAILSLILVMGIWIGDQQIAAQEQEDETDLSYSLFSQNITLGESEEYLNEN